MKYQQLIDGIVDGLGGIENISFATHCATRLRMKVRDTDKASQDALKKVKGVLGIRDIGDGEIQIIVGTDIENIYDAFVKITGYDGPSDDGVSEEEALARATAQRMPRTRGRGKPPR